MILSQEQIERYIRQIVIPEIKEAGQRLIIESSIFAFTGDTKSGAPLLYYLASSGVGHISCCFIDSHGYERIFENVRDINNECKIDMVDIETKDESEHSLSQRDFTLIILLFEESKIEEVLRNYSHTEMLSKPAPMIIAIYNEWKGFINFFDKAEDMVKWYSNLNLEDNILVHERLRDDGSIFSSGLLGAIAAIEAIKFSLKLGSNCKKPLYFDLLKMEFIRDDLQGINTFQMVRSIEADNDTKKNINKLKDKKVLIVGTGGLGSPAALALSSAGIGRIGLVDYDSVEISNLNRQILHSTSRIGMAKVESAEEFIKNTCNDVNIIKYNINLDRHNVLEIMDNYDVIIDCVDNFQTRYLLNDASYFAGKPLIEAGVVRFNGLNMTILPCKTPCYRCLFPDIPKKDSIPSCAEMGVLGPIPGVMGFIQGAEAYKLLTGYGELLTNKIMYFDALDLDFNVIIVDRTNRCKLCGASPSINGI